MQRAESHLWAEVTFKDTGPVFLYNQRSCLLNQNKNAFDCALRPVASRLCVASVPAALMARCLLSRRGDQECLGHEGLRVLAAGIRCHSSVTCRGDCCVFVSVTFFISTSLWFIVLSCVALADSCSVCCFALDLLFWGPFVLVRSFGSWRGILDINGMC